MKINSHGIPSLLICFGGFLGFALAANWLNLAALYVCSAVFAIFVLFFLWFFRDPERHCSLADNTIVTGADGRVLSIIEHDFREELKGPATQVSIFMSPFNVHVNRASIQGEVLEVNYRPGKYLMAFNEKSSELNEASTMTLRGTQGAGAGRIIAQTQIAGFLARRIVGWTREGKNLKRSERYGMIKLGSRMDHFLPPDTRILVEVGQKVRAGETPIGEWT